MKPFIGIKQLWYGNVLTSDLTGVADITALLNDTYTAVSNPSGSPKAKGYYEQSGTAYVLSNDTEVQNGKTYYTKTATTFTEILNVHEGTWGYSHDDPSVTEYINELTGQPYYRDKTTLGARTINFTLGVYDFATKAALQGGSTIGEVGWKSSGALENVNKCIIAKTKTGNWIVFSNASIVAKGDQQEKNIGLGITAVCMENETSGVEAEYMFEAATA